MGTFFIFMWLIPLVAGASTISQSTTSVTAGAIYFSSVIVLVTEFVMLVTNHIKEVRKISWFAFSLGILGTLGGLFLGMLDKTYGMNFLIGGFIALILSDLALLIQQRIIRV